MGPLLFSYNPFVYLGILIAILCGIYLGKTKTGLNVQAIGQNPAAADAAGIQVTKWKYINIVAGGAICGIGGAYCSMIINGGVWISDNVGGLGWIAVALVIFASGDRLLAIWGSFVFGALRILEVLHSAVGISVPDRVYDMLPFLITAVVLVLSSIRNRRNNNMPEALGNNYFREER